MEHIMPTLTQGLIDCCQARPHDPVDFLVFPSALVITSSNSMLLAFQGFDHAYLFWFVSFQAEYLLRNNPLNY